MKKIILFVCIVFITIYAKTPPYEMKCHELIEELKLLEKSQLGTLNTDEFLSFKTILAIGMGVTLCKEKNIYPEPLDRDEKCKFTSTKLKAKDRVELNIEDRIKFLKLKLKNCSDY